MIAPMLAKPPPTQTNIQEIISGGSKRIWLNWLGFTNLPKKYPPPHKSYMANGHCFLGGARRASRAICA